VPLGTVFSWKIVMGAGLSFIGRESFSLVENSHILGSRVEIHYSIPYGRNPWINVEKYTTNYKILSRRQRKPRRRYTTHEEKAVAAAHHYPVPPGTRRRRDRILFAVHGPNAPIDTAPPLPPIATPKTICASSAHRIRIRSSMKPVDSIQLAIALNFRGDNLTFVSSDRRLCKIATEEGLDVVTP
jgi:hypothetical protein